MQSSVVKPLIDFLLFGQHDAKYLAYVNLLYSFIVGNWVLKLRYTVHMSTNDYESAHYSNMLFSKTLHIKITPV